jgi:glutamate synthase (NADPH) small chain
MDASRTAIRSGAKDVFILYRKGFENMICTKVELEEAKEDGVQYELFKIPLELTKKGVKYIETENATGKVLNLLLWKKHGVMIKY